MPADLRATLDAMLTRLTSETLARAASAQFKRVMDGSRVMAVLEVEPNVRIDANGAYAQCCSWIRGVAAVLERRGAADAARRLGLLAADLEPLVRCTRRDAGEITETRWRKAFADELAVKTAQIAALIGEHALLFEMVRAPSNADLKIVDIAITANGNAHQLPPPSLPDDEYGQRLYETTLRDASATAFDFQGAPNVRYQIWLDNAGPLAAAQWERLHDGREFIALRRATSIARAVAAQDLTIPDISGLMPLRVLVTISAPNGAPPIGGATERAALEAALAPLVVLGRVELEFAPDGRLETLRRLLRAGSECGRPFRMWHFIGHGSYDRETDRSALIMEKNTGQSHRVGGDELGFLLRVYGSLSAVVLNCCHGAHGTVADCAAVPGRALAAAGVPAVVAMQSAIRDDAANIFAEELYGSLCDGRSIDEAVAEARRRLFLAPGGAQTDWATPVLFVAAARGGRKMASHLYGKPPR